jgi:hypothetical protein
MSKRLPVKYPLFLSDFDRTCIFSTDFRKKKKNYISSVIKIRLVTAEFFQEGRQTEEKTDRHGEANSRFSQFCERA